MVFPYSNICYSYLYSRVVLAVLKFSGQKLRLDPTEYTCMCCYHIDITDCQLDTVLSLLLSKKCWACCANLTKLYQVNHCSGSLLEHRLCPYTPSVCENLKWLLHHNNQMLTTEDIMRTVIPYIYTANSYSISHLLDAVTTR